jgi:hypothetical protein
MFKIVSTLLLFASSLFTSAIPQMLGSSRDEHGCYIGAGFQWCEPLNRCIRPWVNACPSEGPMPAPMPAPMPMPAPHILPELGDVCRSGGQETGPLVYKRCPRGSECTPSGEMAIGGESSWICKEVNKKDQLKNCKTWFDGCNHCFVQDGQIAGCTKMYCLKQGKAECLVTKEGH